MKIAKLEIKLILALFLLQFDYKLVDKSGKTPKSLPVQDRNDIQQVIFVSLSLRRRWLITVSGTSVGGALLPRNPPRPSIMSCTSHTENFENQLQVLIQQSAQTFS